MIEVKKGKYGFDIPFIVQDADGNVFDLTGYTVTFKVWDNTDTVILTGTCTIDSATAGTCHYTVASGDFTTEGTYTAELNLTKTDVDISTMSTTLTVYDSP